MPLSESDYLLMLGTSAEMLADALGVSIRHARRYKSGTIPLPEPCRRLLRLRGGDLSALLGDAWQGFALDVRDGLLYVPNFRHGRSPQQISGMFWTFQEVAALKAQVKELQAKAWAVQKVREAERTGSLHAKILDYSNRLNALSAALADDLAICTRPDDALSAPSRQSIPGL